MQPCDNKSAGILAWREGKLLLINRARPPFGLAAPAGHVDQHGDVTASEQERYHAAAIDELREETGLEARALSLIAEGRKEIGCRRGGTWHYWRIYEAEVTGDVKPSEDEVKGYVWCGKAGLDVLLAGGTMEVSGERVALEPVWKEWLSELRSAGKF